jgi:Mitochondrial carrier protein
LRIFGGIVKYEEVIGLYAGLAPAVVGSAVSWGGLFFFYEQLKKGLVDFKPARLDPTHKATAEIVIVHS